MKEAVAGPRAEAARCVAAPHDIQRQQSPAGVTRHRSEIGEAGSAPVVSCTSRSPRRGLVVGLDLRSLENALGSQELRVEAALLFRVIYKNR